MTTSQSENFFRQKLLEESQRWTDENLLSPEQRDAILRRYENDSLKMFAGTVKEFPHFIQAILALGVFLVGLAVLLLISFNWEYLTSTVKLTIVGTVLAAAHCTGFALRKAGWKNWADGAFFFVGIMYGVGIWQIGQVFHMPADLPMLFWLWALGAFLLALALASTPLHLLSVACLAAWTIAAVTNSFDVRHSIVNVFYGHLIPFSAWSLPIFTALGISAGVLKQQKFTATLYVVLLLFWWFMQGIGCRLDAYLTFHVVIIGLICLVLASWRCKNIRNTDLERIGFLLIFGGLVLPSFLWYWDGLHGRYTSVHDGVYPYLGFALPVINVLILFGLLLWQNRNKNIADFFQQNITTVVWVSSFFVLWLGTYSYALSNPDSHYRWYEVDLFSNPLATCGMFVVNVLFVWLAIGLMIGGLKRGRGTWFWYGTVFFLFWAVCRYFDLFSDLGMLGTAAIFLICGLFLLGLVFFWTNY